MAEHPTTEACIIEVTSEGDTQVVAIRGSLADDAHLKGKEIFLQVLGQNPKRILVDLEGMDFISSSGIGLLVSILRRCRQRGTSLPVCGLRAEVLELFKLTRLSQIFEIFENRSAAMIGR
jgi:anti-sigma B factor antagonist